MPFRYQRVRRTWAGAILALPFLSLPTVIPLVALLLFHTLGCGGGGGGSATTTYPVNLKWDPVRTNDDGTPITDLAGYRVYDGQVQGEYTSVTEVDGDVSEVTLNLPRGTFYITVTAFDYSGNESTFSNEIAVRVP